VFVEPPDQVIFEVRIHVTYMAIARLSIAHPYYLLNR
jgi:hypothetical protein